MEAWFCHAPDPRRRNAACSITRCVMRGLVAGMLLSAFAWAGPAAASVLYRCAGPHGELAYVSRTAGYRHCVRIGEWGAHKAHPVLAARRVTEAHERPAATVLPGKPPRAVSANPAVLKITPLGDDRANEVAAPRVSWQPLPVAVLDQLGSWVLPRVLGIGPGAAAPAASAPAAAPANATSSAVQAKVAPSDSGAARAVAASAIPAADATRVSPVAAKLPPRHGAVYRITEKNGTVMYTNIASLASGHNARMLFTYIIECYACNVHSHIDWNTVPLHLTAYHGDIASAARTTGVDAALLRAIIHAESGFNPDALSYKGAQGLMQLMPGTAFELGVGNAFDPAENISGGARYLAMLLHDFHGDVKLAAAAYNAGAGAVTKYGGVPPYAETEVYVKRVALLYARYRKALAEPMGPALATATD